MCCPCSPLSSGRARRAEEVPDGYTYGDEWFESFDGTQMHAGVFLPADRKPGDRHPVILTITPCGTLELPLLRHVRDAFLEGGLSDGHKATTALPAGALDEAVVAADPPPAQVPFPAEPPVTAAPAAPGAKAKSTLRLRLRGKRLLAFGRAPGARKVRLTLKLGRAVLTRRSAQVRGGRFRVTFRLRGVRSGRLEVSTGSLRAAVRLRSRR